MSVLHPPLVKPALPPRGTIEAPAPQASEQTAHARHDLIYTCDCGPDCSCGSVALKPGPCDCGAELVAGRMLVINGTVASLCTCGADCSCSINQDDPTTCSCGNEIKLVDLAGTGIYYCNCGGSCTCNHVASEPGECSCGMQLKTT